jgi:hypothetical protein
MKIPLFIWLAGLLIVCRAGAASVPAAPVAPVPTIRTLAVVVVDSLHRGHQAFYDYDRIAEEFGTVFENRHWPVKVTFERFAANTENHDLELQIFYRGIFNEFGERVYKAWTILNDHGTKHDFGIVDFRYQPRPGMQMDDLIRDVFKGAGEKTAGLIEPFVAPHAKTASR